MAGESVDPRRQSAVSWELDLQDTSADFLVQVRRWAAAELSDLGDGHVTDVTLVIVELLTNAHEHGSGPTVIRLTRHREPCRIDVEVDDRNADELTIGVSRFGADAHRGRGLILVDKIAESWGVTRHDTGGGKTVRARISCENSPCPSQ